MPTQVMLCEFLRFLELKLPDHHDRPKAPYRGDRYSLGSTRRMLAQPPGRRAYVQKEYPLFAGRLADLDRFEVDYICHEHPWR